MNANLTYKIKLLTGTKAGTEMFISTTLENLEEYPLSDFLVRKGYLEYYDNVDAHYEVLSREIQIIEE